MTKWIYSFEGDEHCVRCPLSLSDGVNGEICSVLKKSCNGDIADRPQSMKERIELQNL